MQAVTLTSYCLPFMNVKVYLPPPQAGCQYAAYRPSPFTRSAPFPSSVSVSFVLPGLTVTLTVPAGFAQSMLSASTACFIVPATPTGETMPNTFWFLHVIDPLALIRRPETVLPFREAIGSPPAMIRLRRAVQD